MTQTEKEKQLNTEFAISRFKNVMVMNDKVSNCLRNYNVEGINAQEFKDNVCRSIYDFKEEMIKAVNFHVASKTELKKYNLHPSKKNEFDVKTYVFKTTQGMVATLKSTDYHSAVAKFKKSVNLKGLGWEWVNVNE